MAVMLLASLLLAACGGAESGGAEPTPTNDPEISGVRYIEPPRALTDFTLPASTGESLSLSDLRGQMVLLYFGYTHCPDFCPATLLDFERIQERLGEDAAEVAFVFVSVDPQRDTPEALADYVRRFDPAFIGLSGDEATLQSIAAEYGLTWTLNQRSPEDRTYTVDHTVSRFLIDREGRLLRVYNFGIGAVSIAEDIRELLAGPAGDPA